MGSRNVICKRLVKQVARRLAGADVRKPRTLVTLCNSTTTQPVRWSLTQFSNKELKECTQRRFLTNYVDTLAVYGSNKKYFVGEDKLAHI